MTARTPAEYDRTLLERFPGIAWLEPIRVTGFGGPDGELERWGCRLCFARYGLTGPDVYDLWRSEEGAQAHIKTVHVAPMERETAA